MRVVEDEVRCEEQTGVTQPPATHDATHVVDMATWPEIAQHPGKESAMSATSLVTRQKTAKAERERESTETRCLKNGRKELALQASTDRGAPRAPQLE